MTITVRVSTWT